MARDRKVTRTVTVVTCHTLVCNTETGVVSNVDYELTAVTDTKTALKQLKKLYETDTLVLVKLTAMDVTEVLYGMSEVDFIKYAKPISKYTDSVK